MYSAFVQVWEPSNELGQQPLELVGFDTCLMATVDTAYTFCDLAKYLVASEETEPANGWYYSQWVGTLPAARHGRARRWAASSATPITRAASWWAPRTIPPCP